MRNRLKAKEASTMSKHGYTRHSKVIWPGFSGKPLPRHVADVGRNDPCPCGSGKKYKQCHGRSLRP